jgi:hypothetical protein
MNSNCLQENLKQIEKLVAGPRWAPDTKTDWPTLTLTLEGIEHKEFDLAGQTVNSAYYCDVLRRVRENVRRLHFNFGGKRTEYCITRTHRHFDATEVIEGDGGQ